MPASYGDVIPAWEMVDRLEDRGSELNANGVTPNGQLMLRAAFYIRALSRADDASNASAEARLREALEFYADERNWIDTPSWDGDPSCTTPKAIPMQSTEDSGRICDCGDTARNIINELYDSAISPAGADEGKESEGGLPPIDETLHTPEVIASLQQRAMAPPDPTPAEQREAIARIIRCTVIGDDAAASGVSGEYDAADAILALSTRAGG
jgi:hypothetical protein